MNSDNNFAYDFLWALRELMSRNTVEDLDGYTDAVARYMLVQFGVPVEAVDEANQLFWRNIERKSLGDFLDAVKRIQNLAKDNDYIKEYIVAACSAVLTSQKTNAIQEQHEFMNSFQELLDMKPSQFQNALRQGANWAIGLQYLASQYAETGRSQK